METIAMALLVLLMIVGLATVTAMAHSPLQDTIRNRTDIRQPRGIISDSSNVPFFEGSQREVLPNRISRSFIVCTARRDRDDEKRVPSLCTVHDEGCFYSPNYCRVRHVWRYPHHSVCG